MRRCYVAGKISNLPTPVFLQNFRQAAKEVEALGMVPVLPIDLPHDHDKSWLSHMREDLATLLSCDCVYALSNSATSRGANIEIGLALNLGIPVIYQPVAVCPDGAYIVSTNDN